MLKKENRLKNKKDFDLVFKEGNIIAGKLVFLKIIKNDLNVNRFGFIVSTKISKKAVIRNKVKRILKKATEDSLNTLKKGFDIVIIAKSEIIKYNYKQIKQVLDVLFKKSDLS